MLSSQEVAKRLNVSVQTVRNLIAAGQLECVMVGKLVRVTETQLDSFLQRNTIKGEG